MGVAPGGRRDFTPMSAPTTAHPLVTHAVGISHQVAHSVEETWTFTNDLLGEHLGTIMGFTLALLVIGRLMLEKRTPSNVFAWGLLMLFVPWLGVPLYFLFGGRKSRRLAQAKMRVNAYAAQLAAGVKVTGPPTGNEPTGLAPRRKFAYNAFHLLGDGVSAYAALRS